MKLQPNGDIDMHGCCSLNRDLEERELQWAAIYDHVRIRMGATCVIFPLGDVEHENAGRTGGTLWPGGTLTYAYPGDVRAFDTPPYYHSGPAGIPILSFNGVDEYVTSLDDIFWTRGDGSGDLPGTWRIWASIPDVGDNDVLFSKYNVNGESEWYMEVASTDSLRLILHDKVNGVEVVRRSDGDVALGVLTCFHATYDGSGDPDGIKLYENGVLMASGSVPNGSYVKMRDSDAKVYLARNEGATPKYHSGQIAGGPLGPAFCHEEMARDVIKGQYHLERACLGEVGA